MNRMPPEPVAGARCLLASIALFACLQPSSAGGVTSDRNRAPGSGSGPRGPP